MAVQQRMTLLQQYWLALGGAVTSPPNLLSCRSRGLLHRELGRANERLSTEDKCQDSYDRPAHKTTYLVNPSRYPSSHRFRHPQPTAHNTLAGTTRPCSSSHSTTSDCKLSPLQDHYNPSHFQTSLIQSTATLLSWREPLSPLTPSLSPSTPSHPLTQQQILSFILDTTLLEKHVPSVGIVYTSSPSPSLSTSPHPPPSPPRHDKATPSQLAFILLKLREELPAFFGGHHTMELYAKDMTFENSLGPKAWTLQGVAAYSVVLGTWKVTVKACFLQTRLELIKITKDPDEGKIEARWRACGTPRTPWNPRERIIIEAFSTFYVNSAGNIITHRMDKVMPGGKERNRVMSWLTWVGVALSPTPQHSVEAARTPQNDVIHV